jgi:hypothetical protein
VNDNSGFNNRGVHFSSEKLGTASYGGGEDALPLDFALHLRGESTLRRNERTDTMLTVSFAGSVI